MSVVQDGGYHGQKVSNTHMGTCLVSAAWYASAFISPPRPEEKPLVGESSAATTPEQVRLLGKSTPAVKLQDSTERRGERTSASPVHINTPTYTRLQQLKRPPHITPSPPKPPPHELS
ncbi:hypothetical protein J6590_069875 [Homalodisca vitripennis]|nr:hypothetical protein J6590_069875 [Homalodisca vitripennis]